MLNRKAAPQIHPVTNLKLPKPVLVRLTNGIPVFVLDYPGQELVKLEIVYRAGRPEEKKRLASRATARLVREGTARLTSGEIAEHIDFYGGTLSIPTSLDTANFLLYSLKKYLPDLLPVVAEALLEPNFPENELATFRETSISELRIELEKPEVVAYRKITELIFGENHPYGYNSVEADYNALTSKDLREHYDTWFTPTNCQIYVSGRVDDAALRLLDRHFGQSRKTGPTPNFGPQETPGKPRRLEIPHPGSMQKAIKIGRRLFNKTHPDYNGLFVLNTILGGYFGSRLMLNIREKKGYTYNIYSTADAMWRDGCLYIASEVNPESATATVKEIWKEMKKLRERPVPESELSMVKNYLLGMLLNGLDGPLNTSDVVKSILVEDLPLEYFDQLVETIRTISAAELQVLAERYFQKKDFWEVVVG